MYIYAHMQAHVCTSTYGSGVWGVGCGEEGVQWEVGVGGGVWGVGGQVGGSGGECAW